MTVCERGKASGTVLSAALWCQSRATRHGPRPMLAQTPHLVLASQCKRGVQLGARLNYLRRERAPVAPPASARRLWRCRACGARLAGGMPRRLACTRTLVRSCTRADSRWRRAAACSGVSPGRKLGSAWQRVTARAPRAPRGTGARRSAAARGMAHSMAPGGQHCALIRRICRAPPPKSSKRRRGEPSLALCAGASVVERELSIARPPPRRHSARHMVAKSSSVTASDAERCFSAQRWRKACSARRSARSQGNCLAVSTTSAR